MDKRPLHLMLPATSANLGPGFDAVGLALSLFLTIDAQVSTEFAIHASGRDAGICGQTEDSLLINTYRETLRMAGKPVEPLALTLKNQIPLGMGCGSSAAAILAGVALANHFGFLELQDEDIVSKASALEGHPDNVAACWYGGFTVVAQIGRTIRRATFKGDPSWRLLLAMQKSSLETKKARALLPETYSKTDAVFSIQRSALLVAAFAQNRLDLLSTAMGDRLHQPYRMEACPLLGKLLACGDDAASGIAGVALSGAGPSVLMVLSASADEDEVRARVRPTLGDDVELLSLEIAGGAVCH